jgi:GDP-4-dehydro-6-deoxy-D-mannose reductase
MPGPILITGAAGFAGSHLVDLLAHGGTDIVAWHRPGGSPPFAAPATTWQAVDLLDRDRVRESIAAVRPSAVYHCAGSPHIGKSWNASEPTFATNVRGTHYLLSALDEAGVEARVMLPSSAMVYRPADEPLSEDSPLQPPNPYGLSKLAMELLAQRTASDRLIVTIGRPFNHIGPRQDPVFAASGFAKQIAEIESGGRGSELVVGNLDARREVTDVRDTVRAYQTILERGRSARAYNVSSGHAVAIGDILEMLCARASVPIHVRVDPSRFRPNDTPLLVGDSTRLRDELGWTPTVPLTRTLDDLLDFWRGVLRDLASAARPLTPWGGEAIMGE